jgi:HAD superfamily hydrolase (TIGR01509 family)
MNCRLVIFDLDGVLVDACEWHRQSLNESLKEVCNYEIPLEEHNKIYNGLPTRVKLKKLFDNGIISESDIKNVELIKQEKTKKVINDKCTIRQEKIDLVNFLKNKNIKIACYTNSIKETAFLMLKKTGIIDYFDLIVTNEDVKFAKPDPEGYCFCIDYFGFSNKETLIIEDSENGIQAAKKSGALVHIVKNINDVNIDKIGSYINENFDSNGW